MGPILPTALAYLMRVLRGKQCPPGCVRGRRTGRDSGRGSVRNRSRSRRRIRSSRGGSTGGGSGKIISKRRGGVGWIGDRAGTGGPECSARMWVYYKSQLTALSLRDKENICTIMAGSVLPVFQGHVICKNWNLCELFWGYFKHKNLHVPNSLDVAAILTRLLKTVWVKLDSYLNPVSNSLNSPPNSTSSINLTPQGMFRWWLGEYIEAAVKWSKYLCSKKLAYCTQ